MPHEGEAESPLTQREIQDTAPQRGCRSLQQRVECQPVRDLALAAASIQAFSPSLACMFVYQNATVIAPCPHQTPYSCAPANPSTSSALPSGSCARPDGTCLNIAPFANNILCWKSVKSPRWPPKSPSPRQKFSRSTPPLSSPTSCFRWKSWACLFIFPPEKVRLSKSRFATPKISRVSAPTVLRN